MKEKLTDDSRRALVRYRIERAKQTLKEAEYMRDGGYYNASINRLYYACYYAASALLISNGIETSSHSGVKTMLSLHFVKPGKLSLEHGATFGNLFDKRHNSDYDDFAYCDLDTVNFLIPRTEKFVEAIVALLPEKK